MYYFNYYNYLIALLKYVVLKNLNLIKYVVKKYRHSLSISTLTHCYDGTHAAPNRKCI